MNLQNQLDYLPTLLDGVVVPEGLDADLVRSQIMLDCGLLTPLYSEPATMKAAITHWFRAHAWNLEHLVKLINTEYAPLENYDRQEDWKEDLTSERDIAETQSGKDQRDVTEQLSGTDTTERSVTGDLITRNDVSPYNSATYTPSTETTVSDGQTITNETEYGRRTQTDDDITYGKNINTDDDLLENRTRRGRAHGNIGVTTSQQMAESEVDLMSAFNIYEWIAKEFCSDLMILVY